VVTCSDVNKANSVKAKAKAKARQYKAKAKARGLQGQGQGLTLQRIKSRSYKFANDGIKPSFNK